MNPLLRVSFLAVALCALVPAAAKAQVDKQDNEIAANASLYANLKGGIPQLTVAVHYGKLLHDVTILGKKIDGLQVGGDAIYSGSLDFSNTNIFLFPAARLYFSAADPRLTPYLGVGLGLGLSAFKSTSIQVSANFAYDVNGGIKLFLNPTTAAFVQIDLTGPLTDPGSSSLIVSAGLSVFF